GCVAFYLIYPAAVVSGLMIFKLSIAAIVGWLLFRVSGKRHPWLSLAVIVAGLSAAGDVLDASPACFDVLGVIAVWLLGRRWCAQGDRRGFAAIVAVFAIWGNLAVGFLFGLIGLSVVLFAGGRGKYDDRENGSALPSVRAHALLFFFASAACLLNPRGPLAYWDSMRLLFPHWTVDSTFLDGTAWSLLSQREWDASLIAFWGISATLVICFLVRKTAFSRIVGFFLVQMAAWNSAANLPLASLWMTLLLLEQMREWPKWPSESTVLGGRRFQRAGCITCGVAVCVVLLATFCGRLPGHNQRIGWGLDPQLDLQVFAESLTAADKLKGTASCDGVRAAGMLSWAAPSGIRAYDIPQRALLGGRFEDETILGRELTRGWQTPYQREDGSWGGWWTVLKRRKTRLIIVSGANTKRIRALEPTVWKPIALLTPVIPYAFSGDSSMIPAIKKSLKQRRFVNAHDWKFTPQEPAGSAVHADFWGMISGVPRVEDDLRLARTLRAMNLHTAALRVLLPLLKQRRTDSLRREFSRCQREIADWERTTAGRASRFRELAAADEDILKSVPSRNQTVSRSSPFAAKKSTAEKSKAEKSRASLGDAVAAYRRGETQRAAAALQSNADPESLYALASLSLETGDAARAIELYGRIVREHQRHSLAILSENILVRLQQILP
ncbi:MAG: hypothetical protein IID45_01985, partial [Planctomycetes bacterium]|nr:hypothetical protein [Planctomycetota bacterium]